MRRLMLGLALMVAVSASGATSALAQEEPPPPGPDSSGRQWPIPVPPGCEVPALAEVVFVGTLTDSDFQTARYRIDQVRSGDIEPFAYGGLVDVRYDTDTKYLEDSRQYVIGASVDPQTTALTSKVRVIEPLFAGDDVIGVAESDVSCPQLADPVRTLDMDGTAVDASLLGPLTESKTSLLRALLVPAAVAMAIVFALVALRWILTGIGKGVGSVVNTASEPREVRAANRTRHRV